MTPTARVMDGVVVGRSARMHACSYPAVKGVMFGLGVHHAYTPREWRE